MYTSVNVIYKSFKEHNYEVILHTVFQIEIIKSCQEINFFNRVLIAVLMHILFVTLFNLLVFHLQVDVVGPLLLNASLLLVLTTDYSD